MADNSHKRHIVKAITWRMVGTIDTMLLSWFISGDALTGLKVGASEILTKMLLYYLHERVWYKVNLSKEGVLRESRKRHIAKTVTWRMVGTVDTMMVAGFITGNPLTGLKIGFSEVATKMLLYYLHERAWYKIRFGLPKKEETAVNDLTTAAPVVADPVSAESTTIESAPVEKLP